VGAIALGWLCYIKLTGQSEALLRAVGNMTLGNIDLAQSALLGENYGLMQ
jgi:hypothetical protein